MTILLRARLLLVVSIALAPIPCWIIFASASHANAAPSAVFDEKTEKETVAEARALLTAKDAQKACDLLSAYVKRAVGSSELEDVLGQSLLQLGRKDEATHHFGEAIRLLGDLEPPQKAIKANLARADALYTRRSALMVNITKGLLETCQKLYDTGHTERALGILTGLEPISTGAAKKTIVDLATKIRSAKEAVNLDKGGDESGDAAHGTFSLEGKHYSFKADMDPATVQNVSDVMDDIFNYYVKIYFDDDVKRVIPVKPTIRIFANHAEMMKTWGGEQRPGLGGWWSATEQTVSCYDTRSDSGSTAQMLETLYHEASHHFMWMLAKGQSTPAWINEGTATFFEGAKAMQDRRVLWPDAAAGRLTVLQRQLTGGYPGPTVQQVISFNEPGSYAGEYYTYGWGLVYFLWQYEDPTTLEYVFRPYYATYRDTIVRKGGDPMALFKETFLNAKAPGGVTDMDAWIARWRNWILKDVYPYHDGSHVRDMRLERAKRYMTAADTAKAEKSAKIPEVELLSRALGDLEFIRARDEDAQKTDPDLIVMQADVLERMGRPQGTAAALEQLLDAADKDETLLEKDRYQELESRLTKLDAKNQPLRLAKTRSRNFAKSALKLLDDYQAGEAPMILTGYEVSHLFADALESDDLKKLSETLRVKARDAGLLHGALYQIGGRASAWATIFEHAEDKFDPGDTKIGIGGNLPVGRIFTGIPLTGEYELRCKLDRVGEISRTTLQGVVFAGTPGAQWLVAGIDGKGQLILKHYEKGGSERGMQVGSPFKLEVPLAKEESPTFAVHVYPDDRISIKIGDRAPIEVKLEEPLPKTAFIGVFAKYGRTELESTVLEVFP